MITNQSNGHATKTGVADNGQGVVPAIALPRGGGAIRGIGEKFAANPVTGTGALSVPIATSPGRAGFGPQPALSYDSGVGNGPFGFGWSLTLPAITRKTDKGLPQYRDTEESDVYLLSGAEDLVPVLQPDGTRVQDDTTAPAYVIHRYRPRIEGLFARIERWTEVASGDIHWRSISRENVTTLYGKARGSRIADPAGPAPVNPTRVFSWLICASYDDKGNAIVYEYVAENDDNVDHGQANERNRVRTANRYLKRIKYGNRTPNRDATTWQATDPAQLSDDTWMFDVVFDYDEAHYEDLDLDPVSPGAEQQRFVRASASAGGSWAVRPDPFSSYRPGFEVRSYRRCRRVLMFHHIPALPSGEQGYDGLVRSTEFDYADLDDSQPTGIEAELAHQGSTRFASFIRAVTQSGFVPDDTQPVLERNGVTYVTYRKQSLPPLEFEYSKASIQDDLREMDADSLANLPIGLDDSAYRWVDLDGEGVSGILTEQAHAWFYKPNLGEGRFGPQKTVARKPSLAELNSGRQHLLDLAADGQLDVVALAGPTPGFFERTLDADWGPFRAFAKLPNLNWQDPNLRFVDLNGDGHADVLVTEQNVFTWHPSLAEAGFGPARQVRQPLHEEHGPRLVLADGTQSIYLADMCGDGLTDLVRIRNGAVCYWPNLGYGRFGAKVTMDDAPWLDNPDQFDQHRIRLADIDGSGSNDLIYLGRDGVRLYFNQSGNRWSAPRRLGQFPRVDNLSEIAIADLLGNGTACLIWSSPLPGDARRPMRYIDLMGGQKPHLLVKTVNNLGAETRVDYAPSTKFYLQDKRDGKPWITRLPFPVHVVERVETFDHLSRNRFVTRYAYHHGHFDGEEREFRGFGLVEQFDTETFAVLSASGELPVGDNVAAASHVPPVLTRTWFHTGILVDHDRVSQFFAGLQNGRDRGEYYREPTWLDDDSEARKHLLPDTALSDDLTVEETREAARALKGLLLRQEVYALDGVGRDADYPNGHPYSVAEQTFTVRRLQPRGDNPHAVFFTHPGEALTYHYEREPAAPRIQHALTLEVDGYGNVLKAAAIGYGRGKPDPTLPTDADRLKQTTALLTYTESDITNPIDDAIRFPADYRAPLPAETATYELTGYTPTGAAGRYRREDFVAPDPAHPGRLAHLHDGESAYEAAPAAGRQRRPIERVRSLYRQDDLRAFLPSGGLEPLALPGERYKQAFTPGLLAQVYRRPLDSVAGSGAPSLENLLSDPAAVLPVDGPAGQAADRGGYVDLDGDGHWWVPSGRAFQSPTGVDGADDELAHARQHFFLPHRARDPFHTEAVGTESSLTYDRYDLLLLETRDALGNRVTVGERLPSGDLDPASRGNDYRVLQPRLVTDTNGNRAEVAFDILGMAVGTAAMGKAPPAPVDGDSLAVFDADPSPAQRDALFDAADPHAAAPELLRDATTRIVYDLDRFRRTRAAHPDEPARWQPACAATLARETHVHDPLPPGGPKIQIGVSYSDGFGREIQKKVQAEPGPVPRRDAAGQIIVGADGQPVPTADDVSPRWVGSGWTIFNNKGKPVRQYEPFFSDTQRFEFDVRIGVSPVLFYDPAERVVATLHPDHTWQKVLFDPWQQTTFDVNDTVIRDPSEDDDVKGFLVNPDGTPRLPTDDYRPTWHALRTDPAHAAEFAVRYPDPADRANETRAATKAAAHADTPISARLDALGRPFLTVARNRVVAPGHELDGTEETFHARVQLDIEGNQRAVRDAIEQDNDPLGRVVMRYDYDMLGHRIHQASMEAGERWMLGDVSGQPIRAWDSRGHAFRSDYDPLRRPLRSFVTGADPTAPGRELLTERLVYGEQHPESASRNLRGKRYLALDQVGAASNDAHDFKGNPLATTRRLAQEYRQALDWGAVDAAVPRGAAVPLDPGALDATLAPLLEADIYISRATFDALNRPTGLTAPDSSVIRPTYNDANLLERVEANLQGATVATPFVTDIDYDAKGQRTRIEHGNGVRTAYEYDPLTFRLCHLHTVRGAEVLQELHYTYDPVGNITAIRDDAQQTIFFRNQRVEPSADYTYDALYRLLEATGREHLGQIGGQRNPPTPPDAFNGFHTRLDHPGDGNAMGTYVERYVYDAVGNFLKMQHRGSDPAHAGWTRTYSYHEPSLLEDGEQSNRLSSTTVGMQNGQQVVEPYTYDAYGSMTHMPHLPLMVWDYRDQLHASSQQVVNNGGTPEITYYVYDAAGQRARKVTERQAAPGQSATRKEERIYLGGFEIYREYNGSGTTVTLERQTLHVMDDTRRIALVETRTLAAAGTDTAPQQRIRYQFGNHLGSASLELDDEAQIISYEEYYPYGSTSYQAVRSQTETPKRYRYTGMERDEETGFTYHVARYYTPWLGRWVSCDPAGLDGGPNLYGFGQNNPVVFVDSSGQSPDHYAGGQTDIAEAGTSGLKLEKDNFWTYTNEAGDIWNLVDIYGEQQETELRDVETKTEGGIKLNVWSFWLFEREESTTRRYQVPITTSRSVLKERVWINPTPEVIEISGSAPKEEIDHWYSPWNLFKTGVDLWSPTGKAKYLKWGIQFAMSWRDSGSAIQAAKNVTINGIKNKVVDTILSKSSDIVARLGGKVKIPSGTHLALGRNEVLEQFAESQGAVSIFGAYDRKYFVAAADPNIFKGQFDDIAGLFINDGGRIKFDLTGMTATRVNTVTSWELQRILGTDFLKKTDFFENGVKLTGQQLERRLAPWR